MSHAPVIDITDLVEQTRSTFVTLAAAYIDGLILAIPGIGGFLLFMYKFLGRPFVNWVLDKLSKWEVMQAFFLNTALRKASQAKDFVDATTHLDTLPEDTSNAVYLAAEKDRADKFKQFVAATN